MKKLPAIALALLAGAAHAARAQEPSPSSSQPNTPEGTHVQEQVVVSAARGPEIETEIPGQVEVVTGIELRREGAKTLADAIEDLTGIDTGIGSDNGARQPNIGEWGLKEFDALLVMVDGRPVGGPFNPSLSQIPIDDIDHIEIVKGPQGTLYGVSAFAGMIQVFTRSAEGGSRVSVAGGSFSEKQATGTLNVPLGASRFKAFGSIDRSHGWQDRTDYRTDRVDLRLDTPLDGGASLSTLVDVYRDTQFFGSPLPVDPPTGTVIPGFRVDRNYAVRGARLDHHVASLTSLWTQPLSSAVVLENDFNATRDDQISVRSFVSDVNGNSADAAGVAIKPHETDVYDDLHLVANFDAAGSHRLVAGAAVTWGRTTAKGTGFDFQFQTDPAAVPELGSIPAGDHRSFVDRRTFAGFYVNDEWTPIELLTVTAGARFDHVSESLFAKGQEVGDPEANVSRDSRTDGQWSGGISALARLIGDRPGAVNEINVYAAAKSAFKPAAPNLSEAEKAEILDPERTRSGEIGIKTRWLDRQLAFDASIFHMIFENLVVSIKGPNGEPMLVNAGEERFQGMELSLAYRPKFLPDFAVRGGYAHHDAKYVRFTFIDLDEGLLDAAGQRLELTPRDLWNLKASYAPALGPGAFVAVRHQNHRPFDKINEAYMPSFEEWDAGLSWGFPHVLISVVGRNLGDSRHYVAESEIGDAQLYVAPPRRFLAQATYTF